MEIQRSLAEIVGHNFIINKYVTNRCGHFSELFNLMYILMWVSQESCNWQYLDNEEEY